MYAISSKPSKLNAEIIVPTIPAVVIPIVPPAHTPVHATDVAVVQLVVLQSATASTAVCVSFAAPNSMPASISVANPKPTLYGDAAVMAGAATEIRHS